MSLGGVEASRLVDLGIEINIITSILVEYIGLLVRLNLKLVLIIYTKDTIKFNSVYKNITI